eukprot:4181019-Prymnesium_polylepis.1
MSSYGRSSPFRLSSRPKQSDDRWRKWTRLPSAPYRAARVLIVSSALWSMTRENEKSMITSSGSSFGLNWPVKVCVEPKNNGPFTAYVGQPSSPPSSLRTRMAVDCFQANESAETMTPAPTAWARSRTTVTSDTSAMHKRSTLGIRPMRRRDDHEN